MRYSSSAAGYGPGSRCQSSPPLMLSSRLHQLDRAELLKQRNTLRANISKAKKSAREAKSEDKRSHYTQKAGKLEVELNTVELQLVLSQV